jgi:hypothetical protein
MRILAIALATAICASLANTAPAFAQAAESTNVLEQIKENAPPPETATPAAQEEGGYGAFRIQQEITHRTLMLAVIVAAIVSLLIILWFLKLIGTRDPVTIVNASGLVLVVYATVLVVILARADQQLTAAMGILGAVAGYLFGATTRTRTGTAAESGPKSGAPQP